MRAAFSARPLRPSRRASSAHTAFGFTPLAAHKVSYPSVSDPQGNLPKTFGLKTMPTSYLIDRAGVVRYVHPGFRASDVDELRKKIKEVLNSGSLPASPEAKR